MKILDQHNIAIRFRLVCLEFWFLHFLLEKLGNFLCPCDPQFSHGENGDDIIHIAV